MYITSANVGEYSRDISSVYHLSCEWDSNPSQVSFIDLRKYKWILNMVLNAFLLNVEKYTSLTKHMNHWLLSTVPISRDPDLGEWVRDVKIGEIVKIGSGLRITTNNAHTLTTPSCLLLVKCPHMRLLIGWLWLALLVTVWVMRDTEYCLWRIKTLWRRRGG